MEDSYHESPRSSDCHEAPPHRVADELRGHSLSPNRPASGSCAFLHVPRAATAPSSRLGLSSSSSAAVPAAAAAGSIAPAISRTASCCATDSVLNKATSARSPSSRNDPTRVSRLEVSAPNRAMARSTNSGDTACGRFRFAPSRPSGPGSNRPDFLSARMFLGEGNAWPRSHLPTVFGLIPNSRATAPCVKPASFLFRLISSPNRASPRRT